MYCATIILAAIGAIGITMSAEAQQPAITLLWRVIGNDTPAVGLNSAELIVESNEPLAAKAALYFNFGRKPADGLGGGAAIGLQHVNGDLFRLTLEPTQATDGRWQFTLISKGSLRSVTDAPAGFFLVLQELGGAETVVPITAQIDFSALSAKGSNDPETAAESRKPRPTVEVPVATSTTVPLVPQPSCYKELNGFVRLGGLPIGGQQADAAATRLLRKAIVAAGGASPDPGATVDPDRPAIHLAIGEVVVGGVVKGIGDESYSMVARPESGVRITGSDRAGLFYGVQTLIALLEDAARPSSKEIGPVVPAVVIQDQPHFGYRGLHLDVARNFQTVETVRKLLDLMATYKLNRFHLHLTDDEGWRLAIRGLPELTRVGSQRGYSPGFREFLPPSFGSGPDASVGPGSGYYTREDFVGLLRYAAERHIEVIPEIDLPGHARAAIRSMQSRSERLLEGGDPVEAERFLLRRPTDTAVYESVQMWSDNVVDVRLDSTHAFVSRVIGDVAAMYSAARLPLETLHLGGDEVPADCWGELPKQDAEALFASFMDRCSEAARSYGARPAGWEEVFLADESARGSASSEGLCYVWNNIWGWGQEDAAYRLANAGVDVVLCNATHLYFDLAYQKDVNEPGYYWAGTTDTEQAFGFRPYTYFEGLTEDRLGNPVSEDEKLPMTRLTAEGRDHVLGIQGHLWGENLTSVERLESLAFPRVLALAERAWAGPATGRGHEFDPLRSWEQFARHVGGRELPRLDRLFAGVAYRIPSVRVKSDGSTIEAESDLPGMTIRYEIHGAEPDPASPRFSEPLPADASYRFRAFDTRGRSGRTTTWTPLPHAEHPN